MAIIDTQTCVCDEINLDVKQTLFLGASVQSFTATAGWNNAVSSLDVVLYEDYTCGIEKCCYSSACLSEQTYTDPDPGFFGDPRWERAADRIISGKVAFAAGTQYSSCTPENLADTLVRPAINLEGVPVFFKWGDFEWCGMVSDWAKDISCDGIKYRVKIVDPKIILEKVNVIIGDYQGTVFCDPACPNANLINVYGFMEFFDGVPCTGYAQQAFDCNPADTEWGFYDNVTNLGANVGVDGLVFGTPSNGFGGSCWTEDGMPWNRIRFGLNALVNKIPSVNDDGSGFDVYSPYGRVVFCKPSYFNDWSNPNNPQDLQYGFPTGVDLADDEWCGLMPHNDGTGCFDTLNYYYLDLSELDQVFDPTNFACGGDLPTTLDKSYRLSGTSMTVMEMIDQMSSDFGFDYYIDLVPVKNPPGAPGETCTAVEKFIKLRIINKKVASAQNNAICSLTDFPNCQQSATQGRELRTDNSSRFVLGAHKQTIYQARQDTNPDQNFTTPTNDATTLAGYTIFSGATPVTQAVCPEMDDTIIPYMGTDQNDDILTTCIVNGEYCWNLPTVSISSSLTTVIFDTAYITVCETEMRAALVSYELWLSIVLDSSNPTNMGAVINRPGTATEFLLGPLANAPDENSRVGIDFAMPQIDRFLPLTDSAMDDLNILYSWVQNYAQENLGRKWAVRVPFTCCYPDNENNKVRMTEQPTNDGGWTETCEVLGLPNGNFGGTTGFGYELGDNFELKNVFLTEERKIKPFVRFEQGVLQDASRLPKDSFFYKWTAIGGLAPTTGQGIPAGAGALGATYQDTNTGMIYVGNGAVWLPITTIPATVKQVAPANGVAFGTGVTVPFLWHDSSTGLGYIVTSYTTDGNNEIDSINFLGTISSNLFVSATVEEEYVFHDKSLCYVPRVVVSTPGPVFLRDPSGLSGVGFIKGAPANGDFKQAATANVGGEDAWLPEQPPPSNISAAAIPMLHNEIHYGPWCNPSNPSWGGDFIQDDQFAPWSFGSYELMNRAGVFFACAGRKDGKGAEIGNLVVPGYPTLPLGVEIGAGATLGTQYLTESRVFTTSTLNATGADGTAYSFDVGDVDFGNIWDGGFGPNITNITVNVDASCNATTTYSFRSYAPRQGGMDRKLIERVQRANRANQLLVKRIQKLERIAGRLNGLG